MIVIISSIFTKAAMGRIEKNSLILFFHFSATSFDSAVGSPK